jgi:hypothetical protein
MEATLYEEIDETELDEVAELEDATDSWADAYQELMGEDDEVDMFFVLPRADVAEEVGHDPETEDDLLVLRVTGLPDDDLAWVH